MVVSWEYGGSCWISKPRGSWANSVDDRRALVRYWWTLMKFIGGCLRNLLGRRPSASAPEGRVVSQPPLRRGHAHAAISQGGCGAHATWCHPSSAKPPTVSQGLHASLGAWEQRADRSVRRAVHGAGARQSRIGNLLLGCGFCPVVSQSYISVLGFAGLRRCLCCVSFQRDIELGFPWTPMAQHLEDVMCSEGRTSSLQGAGLFWTGAGILSAFFPHLPPSLPFSSVSHSPRGCLSLS